MIDRSKLIKMCKDTAALAETTQEKHGHSHQMGHVLNNLAMVGVYAQIWEDPDHELVPALVEDAQKRIELASVYSDLLDTNQEFRENETHEDHSCYLRKLKNKEFVCDGCREDICGSVDYVTHLKEYFANTK